MNEEEKLRALGAFVVKILSMRGPDALDRINDIAGYAIELKLGATNQEADDDTDPWLVSPEEQKQCPQ